LFCSFWSLLVNLDDIVKWNSANRAALASLGTCYTTEVMATGDENCITFGLIADLAGFILVLVIR